MKSFAPMRRRIVRTGSGNRWRVGSWTMVGLLSSWTAAGFELTAFGGEYVLDPFAVSTVGERD